MRSCHWLEPDWPVVPGVRAAITLRTGGISRGAYESLNLAQHVGDDPADVAENRRQLARALGLPAQPLWLTQVHGCAVANAASDTEGCEADAVMAAEPGRVCAVLTADCLPVLMASRSGDRVAAAHAGWRGLAAGVIEQTVGQMDSPTENLQAWMGPAIGPDTFEVGADVRDAFVDTDPMTVTCFRANREGHWLADIYGLARRRLEVLGVGFVGGGGYCTVSDPERFYSYRRDGVTGRMASLIWIEP